MQISGYNQEQRVSVYKAARARYDQQLKNHDAGEYPLYRSKQWRQQRRLQERASKKKTWYGDNFDAVYFVAATPGSQLAHQCQKVFGRCNLKVKVVERTGKTIKQLLVKSNPLRKDICKCQVCNVAGKQICKVRDCVYEMTCSLCLQRYVGETSRSLHERYKEHMYLLERKDNASVMYRHMQQHHKGQAEQVRWQVKILARCPGDPALRQATESTFIHNERPELNGRGEFQDSNRPRQLRVTSSDD